MHKFLRTNLFILAFLTALYAFPASALAPNCSCGQDRVLRLQCPFMEGDDVMDVQRQLQRLGFYDKEVSGNYDDDTAAALSEFQKSRGLVADGIFGPDSLEQLSLIYLAGSGEDLLPSSGTKPSAFVSEGEVALVIDALERTLTVLVEGSAFRTYPVAVGKFSSPTPIGLFSIVHKDSWGEGFGTRWMQISVPWGVYGIHGTNKPWSIGAFESAGCIRMHNKHVEEVFDWVGLGTKVFIFGGIDGPFTFGQHPLTQGSKGSDVVEVQKRLEGWGYYSGKFDGIYGYTLRSAVLDFQRDMGMDMSGNVDAKTYEALGIVMFE